MTARVVTALFGLVCAGGSAAAVSLAVVEARATDPVVASVSSTARTGTTTAVTVALRNTTDRERCVRLRVVAYDRSGHDLGRSAFTQARVEPHARRDVRSHFSLTPRQYDEQLQSVHPQLDACR